MNDVTRILNAVREGDPHAPEELLPLVYEELRKLAALKMAQESPEHTLDATALVHEAYLHLVGDQQFSGRGHFFAAAAEAMRRILIDNARRKRRPKHGGDRRRLALDEMSVPVDDRCEDLLALDEALTLLAREEPVKAELVKLRYFAGLSLQESAACLNLSLATAKRHWAVARAMLYAALSGPDADAPS